MNPFRNWTQADLDAFNAQTAAGMARFRSRLPQERLLPPECAPGTSAKPKRLKSPPERKIQEDIQAYLTSLGTACYWVWHRTDLPTTCRVGTPDFYGHVRAGFSGMPWAMEVKRTGCKPTPEQLGELRRIELAGGRTAVVHSLASAKTFIAEVMGLPISDANGNEKPL